MANKSAPILKNTKISPDAEDGDDNEEIIIPSVPSRFAMLISDEENEDADTDNDEDTTTTTVSSSSKKKSNKKKVQSSKNKKEDDEIDLLLAAIESTSVSTKKGGNKTNNDEGQDLEDILKEINEKFDEKEAKKDKKKKAKGGIDAKTLSLMKEFQKKREEAKLKAVQDEEEEMRLEEAFQKQREEKERAEKEKRDKKKQKEKERIQTKKKEGTYLTKEQREKLERARIQLQAAGIQVPERNTVDNGERPVKKRILYEDRRKKTPGNDIETEKQLGAKEESLKNNGDQESESSGDESSSEESDQSDSSSEDDDKNQLTPHERVRNRLQRRHENYESRRSLEVLRAPVICVLGHVDTGKTKILDNLRRTHVQDGEAGGITQQIGATNVPLETIRERTKMCRKLISREGEFIIPGLLIIDTPGHESFKNLRTRGSSLCDLAILVVDLMHGLEPQTLESIKLLTEGETPFIIALNKIDRLYEWKGDNEKNVELVIQEQGSNIQNEFDKRCKDVIVQFAEQGLNVALYYKNPDPNEYYSMVPTSAHTGDGMGSLIAMIIEKCQTTLAKRLSYTDELQATVMEVKTIGGLGTTIDVILANGHLHVGDTIIVAGQEGPIVTQVRGLLMPESNRESRVRNQYQNYKTIKAARGIKIAAKNLEKAMAGLPLFVGRKEDEVDYYKNEIQNILKTALSSIKLQETGVYVQASTLGSLEALLEFLETSNIPYAGINIGTVHRKDIVRASAQLDRKPQWAVVLAFDVRIERDAQDYADSVGVKIFQADIMYHLFDMFLVHREGYKKEDQEKSRHLAVYPCKLRVLPEFILNKRGKIICGVIVEDGFIKLGTPICVPSKEFIELGRVVSIELNHKPLDIARKNSEVCITIEPVGNEVPKIFGRDFDETDLLMSKISQESFDVVKDHFRGDMQKSDWQLMIELKEMFNIF
ncbi:unnamed protein product [Adineta steineri]|uniref:Eukaryotic translation initiation factor 5B n=2 Tax=Adineta steineri TaxID=433720 RepID=A0A819FY36_9BILA|nr:unnamed protein product [Adineta steineri]CAF3872889.1 unnamed protein product [Adineta steineri]